MQEKNSKRFCSSYGCWECLVPLLKSEQTTSLTDLLKLTTLAEQSLKVSLANYTTS